jgi:hypothetical protein
MAETTFWIQDRFPVLYEGGEARAVLADIASFAQIELIIDNLLNREEEPEDAMLAASPVLQRLVAQSRQEPPLLDWEQELDSFICCCCMPSRIEKTSPVGN